LTDCFQETAPAAGKIDSPARTVVGAATASVIALGQLEAAAVVT